MPTLKILLVEDDLSLLRLMTELLVSVSLEVRPLSDSRQALELINREKFHGIFTDLNMPFVSGFDLARQIRKSSWNKTTPVIIISGRNDNKTMEEAFAVGGTFFAHKPVDRHKLISLVRIVRGSMEDSRRRAVRVGLHMEVVCQYESQTIRGRSVNISMDGILFEAGTHLEPGKNARLSFILPGQSSTIGAVGTIARIDDKQRAGVRFTSMAAKDRDQIRELLGDKFAD